MHDTYVAVATTEGCCTIMLPAARTVVKVIFYTVRARSTSNYGSLKARFYSAGKPTLVLLSLHE